MESYNTVDGDATASIIVKKSRFIAHVAHVCSHEDAMAMLDQRRDAERSARHHAFAYRLGESGLNAKSGDDGEPAGTAGAPLLRSLEQQGISDTILVVSRIFGGVKLGAGGLTRAYAAAAGEVLHAAKMADMIPAVSISASVAHDVAPRLQHYLLGKGYDVGVSATLRHAVLHVVLPESEHDTIRGYLVSATKGSVEISEKRGIRIKRPKR